MKLLNNIFLLFIWCSLIFSVGCNADNKVTNTNIEKPCSIKVDIAETKQQLPKKRRSIKIATIGPTG